MSKTTPEILIFDTNHIEAPSIGESIYQTRAHIYSTQLEQGAPEVSIAVLAYNNLAKTKYCIECILKYTTEVSFELILIDNGSTDETLDYFKSVAYDDKVIYRVTKNIGATYGYCLPMSRFKGKYFVTINQDVYATHHWLSNMLKCIKSDEKIGYVVPMGTNVSNLQDVNKSFKDMADMQRQAMVFNQSDSAKWQERVRILPSTAVIKRDVLEVAGKWDAGFVHNFLDDDYAMRVRRAGYRLMVCGDTFVYHDHIYDAQHMDVEKFNTSLTLGREMFKKKYRVIDAWDDINNYELPLIALLPEKCCVSKQPAILGVDIRCGTPVLEIKNYLRRHQMVNSYSAAFTTQAKYYADLLTVCDQVNCDRMDFIMDYYLKNTFDYLILGEVVNEYYDGLKILKRLLGLVRQGGFLLFKLKNVTDLEQFLQTIGQPVEPKNDLATVLSVEDVMTFFNGLGCSGKITKINHAVNQATIRHIETALTQANFGEHVQETVEKLLVNEYLFCIHK